MCIKYHNAHLRVIMNYHVGVGAACHSRSQKNPFHIKSGNVGTVRELQRWKGITKIEM